MENHNQMFEYYNGNITKTIRSSNYFFVILDWNIIGITLTHSNDLLCRHFREKTSLWYDRLFCSSFMFLERKRTLRFGKRMWKNGGNLMGYENISSFRLCSCFMHIFSNVAGMGLLRSWVVFCFVFFPFL